MFFILLLIGFVRLVTADNPLIAGFGTSYAKGDMLKRPIGEILKDRLEKSKSVDYDFLNLAQAGTTTMAGTVSMVDVKLNQTKQLEGRKPAIIYLITGGEDMFYLDCIVSPLGQACWTLISEPEFNYGYSLALDALRDITESDYNVPIYVFTYPQAVSEITNCGKKHSDCKLTEHQSFMIGKRFTQLNIFIRHAVRDWREKKVNSKYRVKIIPMDALSFDHHVGSEHSWCNGDQLPDGKDGEPWHPNNAGAAAMAETMLEDYLEPYPGPHHRDDN